MTFPHMSLHCKLVPVQYQEYKYDLLKLERSSTTSLIKFSASDNAILAFWLVHCITVSWLPAILPAFDLIWKLMQRMSLGIKKFLQEVKFRWHKIDKKEKQIQSLSTEETQEIIYNAVLVTTKKPLSSG